MKYFVFALLLLVFFLKKSFSQTTDFQTWNSATVEKSISKDWVAGIQEEIRFKDNSTRLRTSYTDIGLKYQLSKSFDLSAAYRFIIKTDETSQRIYTDFSYEWEKGKWSVKPRVRLQHEFITNDVDENYIRPQLTVRYKISKKWEPFIEEELFYHALYYKGSEFDESRTSAGTRFKFNKDHSLKIFYLYEYQFNVNDPLYANVLGISYEFDW